MKDKVHEKLAMAIGGLALHSNGMKKEFYQNRFEDITAHYEVLKGFIREVEENMKKLDAE